MDDSRTHRLAANEAIARQVNEQVEELAQPLEILCECSLGNCTQRLHVPLTDYNRVREHDARFMLVDDHIVDELEKRVGEVGDATVVEKLGEAREVAEERA
jgi:hypothetical protein